MAKATKVSHKAGRNRDKCARYRKEHGGTGKKYRGDRRQYTPLRKFLRGLAETFVVNGETKTDPFYHLFKMPPPPSDAEVEAMLEEKALERKHALEAAAEQRRRAISGSMTAAQVMLKKKGISIDEEEWELA